MRTRTAADRGFRSAAVLPGVRGQAEAGRVHALAAHAVSHWSKSAS
ncbi:hypothetical protein ABZV75_23600 [Streptomyces flaveolus]